MKEIRFPEFASSANAVPESFPQVLFAEGDEELLQSGTRVAVIDSRTPSEEGIRRTRRLARMLAQKGITVTGDLSSGIATEAHKSTMESGGRTIAVLATPFFQYLPAENEGLQLRIEKEHLAVTPFQTGSVPSRRNFPLRDKLLAMVSGGSVLVEAEEQCEVLSAAGEFLALKKPLYILKSAVEDTALKWPGEFIKQGAQVLTEENFVCFLGELA